jgi:hypothetical protein
MAHAPALFLAGKQCRRLLVLSIAWGEGITSGRDRVFAADLMITSDSGELSPALTFQHFPRGALSSALCLVKT